ncbi:MAG: replication factor C large subunit [Candidatus Aenigmarchaeota archaeon]|nr:replication factor C large subunit [Candidatus Aenigmarchaeota archaeon]
MELWTEKYRPLSLEGVTGNKKAKDEALEFVRNFRPGKGLLLHGPPGIGKSLVPTAIAKELGYVLVELDASDKRGKDAIESYLPATKTQTLFAKGKIIVVDEVDGLAGGDRGGGQAIAKLVKGSLFPVFLIANDPWIPKLRVIRTCSKLVKFNKIPSPSIEKFLRDICEKEGVEVEGNVLKSLARFSEGDLRTALTDLQLASLGKRMVGEKDLEAIGYRERATSIHNLLPAIFRAGRVAASRKLIFDGDKDPDEIFWWVESNVHREFSGERLARALGFLAKANLFRGLVMKQQNWAFKGYMVDLIAGISAIGNTNFRYVPYKPPDRLIQLGRSRQRRALMKGMCERLGKGMHCSSRTVRKTLPYLKIMLEEGVDLGLEKDDMDIITR